jgi:hypothetical protein
LTAAAAERRPRIGVIAADPVLAETLAEGARAAGAEVDVAAAAGELPANRRFAAILAEEGAVEEAIGLLEKGGVAVAVLPGPDLLATIAVMERSRAIGVAVAASSLDPDAVAATVASILEAPPSLEEAAGPDVTIETIEVSDYSEKTACLARVTERGRAIGLRRKHLDLLERCLDEMVMNGLYDAPRDEAGRPRFTDVPARSRVDIRVEPGVRVRYGGHGRRFYLAVRDGHGSLDRATILDYLGKRARSTAELDDKAGGAGLGLFVMASSASALTFHLSAGIATEVIAALDLEAPALALEQLAIIESRPDAPGSALAGAAWVAAAVVAAVIAIAALWL